MENDKLHFIKNGMFLLLNNVSADAKARWGKMNAQQMIEHVIGFFNVSIEKLKFDLVTPEEHLPKYKEFLFSDKEFRENTKAPAAVLGEEPLPINYPSLSVAIEKLQEAVENFIRYFKNEPGRKTLHPVFGMLNFEEWVLLHYKHVMHHLRQFELVV
ncbi:MAG: DinB family protein [Ferruginibacter sp.]